MNMIDKRRERTLRLVLNLKFMRRQGLRQGDEMLWGDRRAWHARHRSPADGAPHAKAERSQPIGPKIAVDLRKPGRSHDLASRRDLSENRWPHGLLWVDSGSKVGNVTP